MNLLSFFKPVSSSPSTRTNASSNPPSSSQDSSATRTQSIERAGTVGNGVNRPGTSRSGSVRPKSRPGAVATPGAVAAALRRLATAPAAMDARGGNPTLSTKSSISSSSSRPAQQRSRSLASTSTSKQAAPPDSDLSDPAGTPKQSGTAAPSSPTPKAAPLPSTSFHTLKQSSTLEGSSSTLSELTVEDSDQEVRKRYSPPSKTPISPRMNNSQPPATPAADESSDEDEIVLSSRSSASHSSSAYSDSKPKRKTVKKTATPRSFRKEVTTPRKAAPSASTSPSISRVLRSSSRPLPSATSSPPPGVRSSPRLRAASSLADASRPAINFESLPPLPRLELTAATSSVPNASPTTARGSTTTHSRLTTPRRRALERSNTHPSPKSPARGSSSLTVHQFRTPGGGPRFERDPSGSPLSELAPSPQKPSRSRQHRAQSERAHKSETWRPHSFELVVEVPPSRWRSMQAGSLRREREGPTSEFTHLDDGDEEMRDGSGNEANEESDEEGEDDDESVRASPSRSASKRTGWRKARRTGGRPGGSSSPPKSAKKVSGKKAPSSPSSSSEGEEEDEDVFAAFARARARVAAGETLHVTSPEVSTSSTAPTTVSSAVVPAGSEDHVRRSSRAKHATEHFSPTTTVTGSSRGLSSADVKGKGKAKDEGTRSFERLMKEMQSQQQRGRGSDWLEAKKLEINGSDDDLENPSEDSDDDLPDLTLTDSKRLDTLAKGIAGNVEDEDLLSPDKLAHKKRAREMADILGDEVKKKKASAAGLAGEPIEERQARTMWIPVEHVRMKAFTPVEVEGDGDGLLARVSKAIRDGLKQPSSFPSPIVFFSSFAPTGPQSYTDFADACRQLFALICHPSTPDRLAEKAHNLLVRIAQHAARGYIDSSEAPLGRKVVLRPLHLLGGYRTKVNSNFAVSMSEDPFPMSEGLGTDFEDSAADSPATSKITETERTNVVARWCRIIEALLAPGLKIFHSDHVLANSEVCVKLALDPTSAVLRAPLERLLAALLRSLASEDSIYTFFLFCALARNYRPTRPRTQVEVLRTLPHRTSHEKRLRKWLAWAFMTTEKAFEEVAESPKTYDGSILPYLRDLLQNLPPSAALNATIGGNDPAKDAALFDQATILVISLTDLDYALHDSPNKIDERLVLEQVQLAVAKVDGKLRADVRKGLQVERIQAKNLLTSLSNSLEYQLRRARGQTKAFRIDDYDVDDKDEKKEAEELIERKAKKQKLMETPKSQEETIVEGRNVVNEGVTTQNEFA